MQTIKLTNSDQLVLVDDKYHEFLNQFSWYLSHGYPRTNVLIAEKKVNIFMHRLIANYLLTIDHKDTNPLNNQVDNLRLATYQQNQANKIVSAMKTANTTSQYKGVSWDKGKQRWRTQIKYNGKQINLGRYRDEKEAALAYNVKAVALFGVYARINEL